MIKARCGSINGKTFSRLRDGETGPVMSQQGSGGLWFNSEPKLEFLSCEVQLRAESTESEVGESESVSNKTGRFCTADTLLGDRINYAQ